MKLLPPLTDEQRTADYLDRREKTFQQEQNVKNRAARIFNLDFTPLTKLTDTIENPEFKSWYQKALIRKTSRK